jgi:hypothetical protein
VPGAVALSLGATIFSLVLPEVAWPWLVSAQKDVLAALVGLFVASGAAGYLLSAAHHVVHWQWDDNVYDLSRVVKKAINEDFLKVNDGDQKEDQNKGIESRCIDRRSAWVIVAVVWHKRLALSKRLQGADPKVMSLNDQMHGAGTARVAVWLAAVIGFLPPLFLGPRHLDLGWPAVRYVIAVVLWVACAVIAIQNYRTIGSLDQSETETLFFDELREMKLNAWREDEGATVTLFLSPRRHICIEVFRKWRAARRRARRLQAQRAHGSRTA